MVLDVILVVIVVLAFVGGFKRGFVKTLLGFVGFLASVVIAYMVFKPVAEAVKKFPQIDGVIQGIADIIASTLTKNVGGQLTVPAFLNGILPEGSIDTAIKHGTGQVATTTAGFVADVAIFILLVIAVKLVIKAITALSSIITNLPIIHSIDGMLGGAVGLAYGLLTVYIFCAVVFVFSAVSPFDLIRNMVDQSVVAKQFYTHNIIMDIFMKKPPVIGG